MSLFLKAIDVLNERGWRKHNYFDGYNEAGEPVGPCCIVGACTIAGGYDRPGKFEGTPEWKLLTKLTTTFFVHSYNDSPGVTKEDIINLLRKAHEHEWLEHQNQKEQSSVQLA